jgi:Uncharacterized conserved protein
MGKERKKDGYYVSPYFSPSGEDGEQGWNTEMELSRLGSRYENCVEVEDLDFDGKKDLLILAGYSGGSGNSLPRFGLLADIGIKMKQESEEQRMSKIDEIRAEMVTAMKNKDKERKDTLSMLLAALKNKAIDKREDLTEAEEYEVIKKEIKQTKETMELAPEDRTDIKEQCQKRLAVLQEFAPEEMSGEEVRKVVEEVLAALGIENPTVRDKGKVMKELMPRVKGKADGTMVNKIVGEMLQA